eukprot:m.201446 g.201446  ORF g.201446 m.201446 type:complete len:360 (-) comp15345_c0_seq5:82-1161(-)
MSNEQMVAEMQWSRHKPHGRATSQLADAFLFVDRGNFFPPGTDLERVYQRSPLAVETEEYGRLHQSCPTLYKMILKELNIEPGDSFLNVGSGTGYLSTLVSHLMGPEGDNVGVEIRPGNIRFSEAAFQRVFPESSKHTFRLFNGNIFNCDATNSMKFSKVYVGAEISESQYQFMRRFLTPHGTLIAPVGNTFKKLQLHPSSASGETETHFGAVMFVSAEPPGNGDVFVIDPPPQLWTPRNHQSLQMPAGFREAATILLMVEYRGRDRHDGALWLPIEIWMHIISMLNRQWFYRPIEPLPEIPDVTLTQPHLLINQLFGNFPADILNRVSADLVAKLSRRLLSVNGVDDSRHEEGEGDVV